MVHPLVHRRVNGLLYLWPDVATALPPKAAVIFTVLHVGLSHHHQHTVAQSCLRNATKISTRAQQLSNWFIYIQNCLQHDFWSNTDPHGNIGVQVHNTTCIIHGVKSTEENPLRAPCVMKGSRWGSLDYFKAQDTSSPASVQPSSSKCLRKMSHYKNKHWAKFPACHMCKATPA